MSFVSPICETCGVPAVVHINSGASAGPRMRHLCFGCADREDMSAGSRERRLNPGAVLAAVGLMMLVLSLLADYLAFGGAEGFGWRQLVGVALAGVMILIGAAMWVPTLLAVGLIGAIMTILADRLAFGSSDGFGWQQILGCLVGVCLAFGGLDLARRRELQVEPSMRIW